MRTTLNIPDALIRDAKRRAIEERRTLTDLIVEGLRNRLAKSSPTRALPVSTATGGLLPDVTWEQLETVGAAGEFYR
jgi:hypothetical protein